MLRRAIDFPALWGRVVRPWLRDATCACLHTRDPMVVLVPTLSYGQFLRRMAVQDELDLVGIHFLTPADYWKRLHARLLPETPVADRPELHLLLSTAAAAAGATPAAQSVSTDPSSLMRAVDMLAAAGWTPADLRVASLEPVLHAFDRLLGASDIHTAQRVEREFGRLASEAPPLAARLLAIGFDASHWPLWNVLQGAVRSAASATICLFEPRPTAARPDETWISTWEQAFGEAEPVADLARPGTPFVALTEAAENGGVCDTAPAMVHIGVNELDEARLATAQALQYLSDPDCDRVGILVPGPGVLAREIGRLLAAQDIPHYDTLGRNLPAPDAYAVWLTWIELQRRPGIQTFLRLVAACPGAAEILGLTPVRVTKELQRVYDEIPVDDMTVLAAALERSWPALPEQDSLPGFLNASDNLIKQFNAPALQCFLATARRRFKTRLDGFQAGLSRDAYLRWLEETTVEARHERHAAGSHPHARIVLLAYDRAEWQTWTYLILAGLNDKAWPPDCRDQPLLGQDRIDALNAQAVIEGTYGAGNLVLRNGNGLMLGPAERSALYRRRFYNIVESATRGACFTAALTRIDDPSRPWMPGELLVRLYAALRDEGLSEDTMLALQSASSAWLTRSAWTDPAPAMEDPIGIDATCHAYRIRRDPDRAPGPYLFGLERGPASPVVLSCTAWEDAMSRPELVWLRSFLGVEDRQWDTSDIPFQRVTGIRVHRWMHRALRGAGPHPNAFERLPERDAMFEALQAAQSTTLSHVRQVFARAGRDLPDWWQSSFMQACGIARRLLVNLADFMETSHARGATEWPLPPDACIALPDGATLPVRGRIDLVLGGASPAPCVVIDYKTGGAPSITTGRLGQGEGLQVLLYGLALQGDNAARDIRIAIAHPGEPFADDLKAVHELVADATVVQLLNTMRVMQQTGIFGMRGEPRTEFGHAPAYPIATLRIDPTILQAKRDRLTAHLDVAPGSRAQAG